MQGNFGRRLRLIHGARQYLSLLELAKVIFLEMSSAFYLVAVSSDLVIILTEH